MNWLANILTMTCKQIHSDYGQAMLVHPPSSVSYTLDLPQEPVRLVTRVAMAPASWEWGGDGSTFVVTVTTAGGSLHKIFNLYVNKEEADRRWHDVEVPLDQFAEGEAGISLVEQRGGSWLYRRPRSLPLARLAYAAEVIEDDQAAVERVNQPGFDPAAIVLLNAEPPCAVGPAPAEPGAAEITLAQPGAWRIQTDSAAPGLLILAESAYPGWQVSVDGQDAEALTAYTTIKAVCVPAGAHIVEWQYVPTAFLAGGIISLGALILIAVAGGLALREKRG